MIDLTPFCATSQEGRTSLTTPWTRGAYTYATNGHIGIRVGRRVEITRDDGRPDIEKLFASTPAPVTFAPLPPIPAAAGPVCDDCNGTGRVIVCEDCNGEGSSECCECGQDADCRSCNGRGSWPALPRGVAASEPCGSCAGTGQLENERGSTVMIRIAETLYINARYARMIVALPKAEIDIGRPFDGGGVWFRFDGGIGLIMPMRAPVANAVKDVMDLTDKMRVAA